MLTIKIKVTNNLRNLFPFYAQPDIYPMSRILLHVIVFLNQNTEIFTRKMAKTRSGPFSFLKNPITCKKFAKKCAQFLKSPLFYYDKTTKMVKEKK